MEKIEREEQIFHRNCGEILRLAVDVEGTLEFFISNYFCFPQDYRTFLLNDSILVDLSFERKKQIFKKICEKEEIDKKRIDMVVNAMGYVQKIRNKVAHDEAFVSNQKEGIKLQKRKSVQYKKDEIKITDALVKEVEEKRLFSIQEINKIHVELSESPRRKNLEW